MDEDKVQQLVDRQEIIDRMHWYTSWVDLNRVDKQVEVFAEDGRLTFYGDDHWIEGKDNIQEALHKVLRPPGSQLSCHSRPYTQHRAWTWRCSFAYPAALSCGLQPS